jgi:D-psicose/D-tagatose/L-ribulose 3-epimerase
MAEHKIAAHSLLWSPSWNEASVRRAIDASARLGFDALVTVMPDPTIVDAERAAHWFRDAGIIPMVGSSGRPDADIASEDPAIRRRGRERLDLLLAKTRDIGATHLGGVLASALHRYTAPASETNRAHSAEAFAAAAEMARGSGIRIALEIVNRYENNLLNTVAQGLAHIRRVAVANVVLHLDTFHMTIEETDAAASVVSAAGHIGYIEFGESHRGILGTGRADLRGVARAIARIGYDGPVGLEAFSAAILDDPARGRLATWRATFTDSDALARDGKRLIESELAAARSLVSSAPPPAAAPLHPRRGDS